MTTERHTFFAMECIRSFSGLLYFRQFATLEHYYYIVILHIKKGGGDKVTVITVLHKDASTAR